MNLQCGWRKSLDGLAGCLLLVVLCGCGGPGEKLAATAPVAGKVIFRGAPLGQGVITFFPDDGEKPGVSRINADGTFSLTTYRKDDGAIIGAHTATIVAFEDDPAGGQTMKSLVPVKYTSERTSPLKYVVAEGEQNSFEIVVD